MRPISSVGKKIVNKISGSVKKSLDQFSDTRLGTDPTKLKRAQKGVVSLDLSSIVSNVMLG